jgi:hypothetical protein
MLACAACGESGSNAGENGDGGGGSIGATGGTAGGGTGATGGGESVLRECKSGTYYSGLTSNSAVHETYIGTNGTFVDRCEGGNLVTYDCAYDTIMGPPSDPANFFFTNGAVEERRIDCEGRCRDGVCPNICPAVGDSLRYLSIDGSGNATLEDITNGRSYQCVSYGGQNGYDCTASPMVGDVAVVTEVTSGACPADPFFYARVGDLSTCIYADCVLIQR